MFDDIKIEEYEFHENKTPYFNERFRFNEITLSNKLYFGK